MPLRIIHVSSFNTDPVKATYFGVSFKLSNGLIRAGHSVLNFSDRDVARTSTVFGARKFGILPANRKLLTLAKTFRPNLILFGHAETILPSTLVELRKLLPDVRLVQWNVDWISNNDNIVRIRRKIDLVDATFVSTAGPELENLKAGKHLVAYMPNPVDYSIEIHRTFEKQSSALSSDLLMAAGDGSNPRWHAGIETTANVLAQKIKAQIPDLRTDFPGVLGSAAKYGPAYDDALASTSMALNLSRRNDSYLYSSDRIAQVMGCGLLTFIDRATGLGLFFSDDEVAFYSDEDELIDKIRFYKEDDQERQKIAYAGWLKYRNKFSSTRVASFIVSVAYGQTDPTESYWNKPVIMQEANLLDQG
jgi:hypothetical protein